MTVITGVRGLDEAWSRVSPDKLRANGFLFAMRYLSWRPNGKCIDSAEILTLRNAGVMVGLNWEYAAGDMLKGATYGHIQAREAVAQAKALGYPQGCCIYYSADIDATEAQQGAIHAYLDAARVEHAGYYRVGLYGGFWVVKRAADALKADAFWQTYAWSRVVSGVNAGPTALVRDMPGGQTVWMDSRADIMQAQNGVTIQGANVDVDYIPPGGTPYLYGAAYKPPVVPSQSHAPGTRYLSYKSPMMAGDDVRYVQTFIGTYHCGRADGVFGSQTRLGVEWYQHMRGLVSDGIVGPKTWTNMGVRWTG